MKGRRITTMVGAITLGIGLVATGALAKNACKAECKSVKVSAIQAAKSAKKTCKAAATDAAGKKACNTAFKDAVAKANSDFKTASKGACKTDPNAHACTGSPSGAFLN